MGPGVGDDRAPERAVVHGERGEADPVDPHRAFVGHQDGVPGIERDPEQGVLPPPLDQADLPDRVHVSEEDVASHLVACPYRRFEVDAVPGSEVAEGRAGERLGGEVELSLTILRFGHREADPIHGKARPRIQTKTLDADGETMGRSFPHPARRAHDSGEHGGRECTPAVRLPTRHVEGQSLRRYSRKVMCARVSLLCIVLAAACSSLAVSEPVEILRSMEEGTEIVGLTTSLLHYRFSRTGGTLRSAFVHFASYGSTTLDAVPGWGSGAKPTLGFGVSLPFEVWVGEAASDPRVYDVQTVNPEPDQAIVRLSYEGEDFRASKEFQVRWDALYTMDVSLQIRAPEQRIRLIVGHRPTGNDAPALVFLYDGRVHNAPLAPGSYSRFQGLGLVSNDRVYFLRLDGGSAVPFLGMNASGHPVFGLEATGEIRFSGALYTGRNRYVLLEKAGIAVVAPVGFFSQFLVWVMKFFEWLYNFTGNYGWAILLFTLITRVVTHPLMRNQYRSMSKMQRLAPKLKRLQEKYKDDRQTLQQQMMELYRQEKVNPLGGCLPLILQFPILILLWQAIMHSAEQIHISPGFLWLGDLSQPDPYYIMIVLATGAQLLQQWLTQRRMPEPPTGGTQMIGWVFPIVMALLFLGFPAGLWLYWFLASVLQIGQQFIFDLEMAREPVRTPPSTPDEPANI